MPQPDLDDRRTCNRWLITATVSLGLVTAALLACLVQHL